MLDTWVVLSPERIALEPLADSYPNAVVVALNYPGVKPDYDIAFPYRHALRAPALNAALPLVQHKLSALLRTTQSDHLEVSLKM